MKDVLDFWFKELTFKDWFSGSTDLDQRIKTRFEKTLEEASRGELSSWRKTPRGRLAEIIVLDQFSRNVYRNTSSAFAQDKMALILSQELVLGGFDKDLSPEEKSFAYMPYMHSESRLMHEEAVKLFNQPGLENNYKFELLHKEIIDRFGRYPHRNAILGRESTPEEVEFLKTHKGF